ARGGGITFCSGVPGAIVLDGCSAWVTQSFGGLACDAVQKPLLCAFPPQPAWDEYPETPGSASHRARPDPAGVPRRGHQTGRGGPDSPPTVTASAPGPPRSRPMAAAA